jgi:hypothetical protein
VRIYVYTLMLVLGLSAAASGQTVCELDGGGPGVNLCYVEDGPTKTWELVRTGPVFDYGQVFFGPVPGAVSGFTAYLSVTSPRVEQTVWAVVYAEGTNNTTVQAVLRIRLRPGQRKSVDIGRHPDLAGLNAGSVRVVFERDGLSGIALHGSQVIVLH